MKIAIVLFFLFNAFKVAAQSSLASNKVPQYIIQLTTANENRLQGLLLYTKDSSVTLYPGKLKEWNTHKLYNPVSFNYAQIGQISLQKKNSKKNGMLIGGGVGATLFVASFLFKNSSTKTAAACLTFPLIPVGVIIGGIIGSRKWKKFSINSNPDLYTSFKSKVL